MRPAGSGKKRGDSTMPVEPLTETVAWVPELVSWNTTQRCNLRCSHCYLAAGKPAAAELTVEEGCRLIDQLADAGTQMLILTGGEPLLRRDLTELAAHASFRGLLVVLGTNGMLITSARARRLKEAGIAGVGISLDSVQPELHDGFRGVPGAWRGAVRGIRACVAEGLPVLVQMTVLPWNFEEVGDLIELADREGATGFTLYFLVCTGRGETLSDITPEQYEQALGSLAAAQERYPRMMVRARCAPQISRIAARQDSALVGNAGCLAARQYCRITPDGRVTPCPYLPLSAGSVRERPFADIWQNAPLFQRLRGGTLTGRCGDCEFRELCGGCRARAFALGGDLLGEDPWCAYQPPERVAPPDDAALVWTAEAKERLQRIPPFVRDRVKLAVERHARVGGTTEVTGAELTASFETLGRKLPFRRGPGVPVAQNELLSK
jgi:AdoMet-dependent heme synthase